MGNEVTQGQGGQRKVEQKTSIHPTHLWSSAMCQGLFQMLQILVNTDCCLLVCQLGSRAKEEVRLDAVD